MDLVEDIYRITNEFPSTEKYGLVSQMRRAAISVPSNIAEGAANRTSSQFMNFLAVAFGSLAELDTQIEIGKRLGFITTSHFNALDNKLDRCKGLIYGLRKSIMSK